MAHAQGQQFIDTRIAAEGKHLVAVGVPRNHIQRAQADGASGPKHGNTLRATHITPHSAAHSSTAKIGIAAVRLSMRSSTPPWPGSRLLLSLMPGIYLGDNQFIHSSSRRSGGVRIDSLGDRYWSKTFIEAKRALAMAPTNIARN